MSETKPQETNGVNAQQYTLDGQPTTLLQINEAKNKAGVRIKEEAPGQFKTLQRLNG